MRICKKISYCILFSLMIGLNILVIFSNKSYSQTQTAANINFLSNLPIPNSSFITDVWGYYNANTEKEYALITDNNLGLFIVDVTDPMNPSIASQVNSVPGFDVKGWQHYVYTVNGGGSGSGGIVDISDPENPQVVGSFPSSHNIFISDSGFMYLEFPGLRIYDLNPDPKNPTLLWSKQTGDGHDATVIDNRLYDFHGYSGTYIYDITTPNNPQLLGAITDPSINYHHSGWVTEDNQFLFICDELASHPTADISVWDISDLGNPQKVGQFADGTATVHNLIIIGDVAFTSYYTAGFRVFNITNPAQISIAAEYDTSPLSGEGYGGAFGIYPFAPSGNIYISDEDYGLFLFSLQDTTTTGIDLSVKNIPTYYKLHQNFPNPFNPATTIQFEIPEQTFVNLDIYNLLGQKIRTLLSGIVSSGIHAISWNGKDDQQDPVPSGIYFYKMTADGFNEIKKMILAK